MQTLLRGWVLYILLGLTVLLLYVLAHPGAHLPSPPLPEPQASSAPAEWWPTEVDAQVMQHAARQHPWLMGALSLVSILMFGLGASGIFVTLGALWSGRLWRLWRVRPRRLPAWSFGELGRVLLLILLMAALLPFVRLAWVYVWGGEPGDMHLWITLSMLWLDAFAILAVLAFAVGKSASVWKSCFGTAAQARRAIGTALRSYVFVFPWIFLLLYVIVELAHRLGYQPPMEPIQELVFQEKRGSVLALTALLACGIGPVAEELFFRGVLHTTLRRRLPRVLAIAASAALFAFVHTNVVGFVPIWALGMLLAYTYERTGSLAGPIAIHIAHNTLLMAFGLLMRELLQLTGA